MILFEEEFVHEQNRINCSYRSKNRIIKERLRDVLGISAGVHLVNPKSIARSEGKAKRVTDLRKGLGLNC